MEIKEHKGYKEFRVSFEEFIRILRPDDKSELKKFLVQQMEISFIEVNQILHMN